MAATSGGIQPAEVGVSFGAPTLATGMASRPRRRHGTGEVYVKHGSYYGRWWTLHGGRANRRLGPVRRPGSSDGLTKPQAERRLRELMEEVQATSTPDRSLAHVARLHLDALAAEGRSRSHLETVESHIRVHLLPQFGTRPIDRLDEDDVTRFIPRLQRDGKAPKTIKNVLGTLHSIFDLAIRRRWISVNPCRLVDKPEVPEATDIRFLAQEELEAVLREGIPSDPLGLVERPLYLMAAMTGMRQGELLGLRWRDLDWLAQKVRVRQAWVRGEFKAPKSRRGVRGVPMADLLAGDLERLFQASAFVADDDLVFANPSTGGPLDRSTVRKRFQRACRRAGVRVVRFHDLRHTFGTRMAATGEVSMRRLQEWMGHRDLKTTLVYADYQPDEREAEMVERAFTGSARPSRHAAT
jgi:integrase